MTLQQKFEQAPDVYNANFEVVKDYSTVADKFAIGFAEWIRKETYYEHLTKEFIYKRNVYKCEKELLQIYKQEQQL